MCVCVCVCVCVCFRSLLTQINLPGASSLLVEQREQRFVFSRAPRPSSPPCSAAITLLLAGLGATLSLPGRVIQVVLQRARAYLVLVLEAGRKEGRRKAGREGGREGGKDIYSHRRSTELEELNFLTLTLCTAYS